jgi:transcriptional regulator with XRE-family HTH domain
MSNLSQKCKQYLEANGYTVYGLAKSSGLDRTSIHRLVTGSRIPSLDFLTNFCDVLRINPPQRKEILELYEEAKVGTPIFQSRKYIRQMLSDIAVLERSRFFPKASYSAPMLTLQSETHTVLQTQNQIYTFLESAYHKEESEAYILCNFPANMPIPFFTMAQQLYIKYRRKISLKHLVTFSSNPHVQINSNCNLKTLSNVLPLVFSGFANYLPYYTYSQISETDCFQCVWPYYLIAHDTVLVFSADFTKSILHTNPVHVEMYRSEMERIFQDSRPLMSVSSSINDSLSLYLNAKLAKGPVCSSMESMPCFLPCLPQSLLQPLFSYDVDGRLQRSFPQFADAPASKASPSYFFEAGLRSFLKTGQIRGQMSSYLPPLDLEQRRSLLRRFVETNNGNLQECKMLKTNFPFSENFYLELLPENQLLFCMFEENNRIRFILINESSIFEAFADYLQYMSDSANSYSLLETNRYILNQINID